MKKIVLALLLCVSVGVRASEKPTTRQESPFSHILQGSVIKHITERNGSQCLVYATSTKMKDSFVRCFKHLNGPLKNEKECELVVNYHQNIPLVNGTVNLYDDLKYLHKKQEAVRKLISKSSLDFQAQKQDEAAQAKE